MMKRHITWGLAGLLVVGGTTLAQEAPAPDTAAPTQQQPDQQQNNQQPGGGPGRGQRPPRQGPGGMGMMGRDLNQLLNLTPEQQTQVREIYQKAREEMQQERQAGGQGNRPDRQKIRAMQDELLKAAEAGDDAQVEKLQAEMRSQGAGQFRNQQNKTNDQIEQILTPEQKAKFKQWRTLNEAGLPPTLINNPDALQKAVMKISTLSDMQKNQFEAMFERYNRDVNSPAATPESNQTAALKVASDVVKELKPSQKVLLAVAGRPQRPGGQGGGQPRDGSPATPPAAGDQPATPPPAAGAGSATPAPGQ